MHGGHVVLPMCTTLIWCGGSNVTHTYRTQCTMECVETITTLTFTNIDGTAGECVCSYVLLVINKPAHVEQLYCMYELSNLIMLSVLSPNGTTKHSSIHKSRTLAMGHDLWPARVAWHSSATRALPCHWQMTNKLVYLHGVFNFWSNTSSRLILQTSLTRSNTAVDINFI